MKKQRRGQQIQRVTRRPEIQRPSNNTTGNLKQRKIISRAPVDLATEAEGPYNLIARHVNRWALNDGPISLKSETI